MNGGFGFKPNKALVEDTGVTIIAMEITTSWLSPGLRRMQEEQRQLQKGWRS